MANHERTGVRDLHISAWHRVRFDDDCSAFDVDLCGMCRRCSNHLYVFETTRAKDKATTWTRRTALRLNVPGFLITYRVFMEWPPEVGCTKTSHELVENIAEITVHQIYPDWAPIGGDLDLVLHLKELRAMHARFWHLEGS